MPGLASVASCLYERCFASPAADPALTRAAPRPVHRMPTRKRRSWLVFPTLTGRRPKTSRVFGRPVFQEALSSGRRRDREPGRLGRHRAVEVHEAGNSRHNQHSSEPLPG